MIFVSTVEREIMTAVQAAIKSTGFDWVTVYDIGMHWPHPPGATAWLGMSQLPMMARRGLLDRTRRTGCAVMYQPTNEGRWLARYGRANREGVITIP